MFDFTVNYIARKQLFKVWKFALDEVQYQYRKFNGQMSDVQTRFVFERGNAVAVLIYDTASDAVVLTRQFRHCVYNPAQPNPAEAWQIELVAGMIDPNETPEQAAAREVFEEVGATFTGLRKIAHMFVSPGGTSERIFTYFARAVVRPTPYGGLMSENEDIQTFLLSVDNIMDFIEDGKITDAKTIAALLWFLAHPELRG